MHQNRLVTASLLSFAFLTYAGDAFAGPRGDLKRQAKAAIEELEELGEPADRCGFGVGFEDDLVVAYASEEASLMLGDKLVSIGQKSLSGMTSKDVTKVLQSIPSDATQQVTIERDGVETIVEASCSNTRPHYQSLMTGLELVSKRKFDECVEYFSGKPELRSVGRSYAFQCASVSKNAEDYDLSALAYDMLDTELRYAKHAVPRRDLAITVLRQLESVISRGRGDSAFQQLVGLTREWPGGETAYEDSEPNWLRMIENAEAKLLKGFFDPESAQVEWPYGFYMGHYRPPFGSKYEGWVTCGTVNGRNRFGGFVGSRYFITVVDTNEQAIYAESATGDDIDFVDINCSNFVDELPEPQWTKATTIAAQPAVAAPAISLGDEIAKLSDLHSKGLLTDEEFATAKAKLLE